MIRILIYTFIILVMCFGVFVFTGWIFHIRQVIRKGLFPSGKATMFDVRKLIMEGEKELAIRLYQKIYLTNLQQSKEAVEELERSINEKNS